MQQRDDKDRLYVVLLAICAVITIVVGSLLTIFISNQV